MPPKYNGNIPRNPLENPNFAQAVGKGMTGNIMGAMDAMNAGKHLNVDGSKRTK